MSAPVTDRLGANLAGDGHYHFLVWAPLREQVEIKIITAAAAGEGRSIPMTRGRRGYFHAAVPGLKAGDRYLYVLDGEIERSDPASFFQPDGPHQPSQLIDHAAFAWQDAGWQGIAPADYVIYELHTGTFTPEGAFAAIIPRLDYLKELGITAIELMPVAQFPGSRNWGYDGVHPFAPQNSYGGADGLKALVNAAHARGLAVILDVVYNHLGPEGNYLRDFGPYFSNRYQTPWGEAINFDGAWSDEVRRFFVENALFWLDTYHIDALRIDAVHGIFDMSARHILQELSEAVRARLRGKKLLFAESDLNDVKLIKPWEAGGYGLDAVWNDDFHHALRAFLAGENTGYYQDFGGFGQISKALAEGFVYSGQFSAYRRRRHGSPSRNLAPERFVVFGQNHDQVGNRAQGDRLAARLSLEQLKLAAALVILSPYIPLLFMGEEYGETAPFLYFTSFADPGLAQAVREGRRSEFAAFGWRQEDIPDPQAEATFLKSKLDLDLRNHGHHQFLFSFYRELLRLRRQIPALRHLNREGMEVGSNEDQAVLTVRRKFDRDEVFCIYNFSDEIFASLSGERWARRKNRGFAHPTTSELLESPGGKYDGETRRMGKAERAHRFAFPHGSWRKLLESSAGQWGGDGELAPDRIESPEQSTDPGPTLTLKPYSFILYGTLETHDSDYDCHLGPFGPFAPKT